jgi:hypothetical protein
MAHINNNALQSKYMQSKYMQSKIENEGFLYINTEHEETFKRGEIKDIYNNLICPGIIVPTVSTITDSEPEDDSKFTLYRPLEKCKKIRIYWDQINETLMISTEMKIYSDYDEEYDLSSVNIDKIDKRKCYYCLYSKEKGVILTNIVYKARPCLETSYNIDDDVIFKNHIEWFIYSNEKEFKNHNFENGVLCILDDGKQLEMRRLNYNHYCMLAKPEHISIYIYYILCLNRHAKGVIFSEYFHSLHEYVREFTDAYPEYTEVCLTMSKKLLNFINTYKFKEDADAIDAINKLLEIEPEDLLINLLRKQPFEKQPFGKQPFEKG